MNKYIIASLGAAALLAGETTLASTNTQNSQTKNSGFYVTATAGYGKTSLAKNTAPFEKNGNGLTGFAFMGGVGYRINQYFAVEGGYLRLPSPSLKTNLLPPLKGKIGMNSIYLAAKGIYPINNQFDVFAKAGAAVLLPSSSIKLEGTSTNISLKNSHKVLPFVGAGVDYNITPNIAVTAQGLITLRNPTLELNNANSQKIKLGKSYVGLLGVTYTF